jgi:CHAT domain-containing protein
MASGFDASRDFVLAGGLRDSRNIHFTTHGRLQTQDADLSALVLSQFDSQGRPVDGLLRASDVVRLDLPADLVVLSACETGLGEEIPGEGLVGLPQAFMVAGASRVLVSLWPVDDLASSKLMNRFYHEYIAEGRSPAAALREAQIAIWRLRRYEAPFFWGAFELQGDWRPADPPR